MEQARFGEDRRRFSNSLRVSGGPCAVVLYKSSGVLVSRLSMVVASVRERWGSRVCLRRRRFFSDFVPRRVSKARYGGITRTRRVEAASSYSLKLVGLSEIKAGSNVRSYMNQMYLLLQGINGYKLLKIISRRLILYPLGNDNDGGKDHFSIYFGIAQFIELSTLKDQKNGYAVKDTCTFGVDIAILKPAEKLETVTFLHNPPNNKFTWKIFHFSNLSDQEFVLSDQFLAGQRYW
ncbi:hypothetical protein Bca52824_064908 [Brassica carinata]|uniref:MATH domain-containing protein n=1 Tax=Brassica carinata TaxID=52824 RepID=A0A8X7QIF9_BRACI|nr:hypothetical protein Bca52824_064908 [Brassica carinata]